jgi:hypothetical protein
MVTLTRRSIAGWIAAGIVTTVLGFGLTGCQTPEPVPQPVVQEDPHLSETYAEQAAARLREAYSGRPADRVAEDLERQAAEAQAMRERFAGRPADRIVEELEAEARASEGH